MSCWIYLFDDWNQTEMVSVVKFSWFYSGVLISHKYTLHECSIINKTYAYQKQYNFGEMTTEKKPGINWPQCLLSFFSLSVVHLFTFQCYCCVRVLFILKRLPILLYTSLRKQVHCLTFIYYSLLRWLPAADRQCFDCVLSGVIFWVYEYNGFQFQCTSFAIVLWIDCAIS